MKIKNLWISKYKNVTEIDLTFNSDLITLLVGKNGLGKSNLIEILALIFKDLDLIEKETDFENWAYDKNNFEYEITYECKKHEIKIHCYEGEFKVWLKSIGDKKELKEIDTAAFIEMKGSDLLPKYIIGYYSGENKRIRDIIRPHEEITWDDLKQNERLDVGLRRLFFSENKHSQLILLTLLLYKKQSQKNEFQEMITKLFDDYTSFNDIKEFHIELRNPLWFNVKNPEMAKRSVFELEENFLKKKEDKIEFPFWNAKGKADKILNFLYENCVSTPIYYNEEEVENGKKIKIEKLSLRPIDHKKVSKQIVKQFGHPINFFDAMESLDLIGSLENIELDVKSKIGNVNFSFRQLSEGEQQLITVLGLILITGEEDCLFLLDEPDTHLNPNWQRDFVELLTKFNLNDLNSHIIVATHSPLIVQSSQNADVILFHKDENTSEIIVEESKIPYSSWRTDHVLTSKYFGLESARTKSEKLDEFMKLREEILSKEKITKEDLEKLNEHFKDDILPTGETFNDLKAMQFIRSEAEKK